MELKLIVSSLFLSILTVSCSFKKQAGAEGMVKIVALDYDSASNTLKRSVMLPTFRIWYRDSTVVQEILDNYIHTDSLGNTAKAVAKNKHFTYIDLSKKCCIDFSSFSDTGRIIRSYSLDDRRHKYGFNFTNDFQTKLTKPINKLSDTTIDGHHFNRYEVFTTGFEKGTESGIVAYADCNKKGTVFNFAPSFNIPLDCPITRVDYLGGAPLSFQINFVKNYLNAEERKVFKAWGQIVKKMQ